VASPELAALLAPELAPERPWRETAKGALVYATGAAAVAMFAYATASQVSALKEVYWAPIAAVVVLYPGVEATKKAALSRFFGTTLGSLIGWACAAWWHHNLLLYGVAVVIAVGVCYLLRLQDAARLCAVAVTVITLVPRAAPPHIVAFHRFLEVSYGVACALAYTVALEWLRRLKHRATT
jgi:uncharacterized membrane protein YccC